MSKDEIRVLQDKASGIYDFFAGKERINVSSGEEIYDLNRNNAEDAFIDAAVADSYRQKFEWYLNDSPLVTDDEFFDIEKEAAAFKERYKEFFQKG